MVYRISMLLLKSQKQVKFKANFQAFPALESIEDLGRLPVSLGMSSFTIPAFFGKLSMGTSPLPVLRQRKAEKKEGKNKRTEKNKTKQNKTKPKKTNKQTNKEKQRERKKNRGLKRFRTHELCHILGQCIAYCMHVVHTVHTLSLFF